MLSFAAPQFAWFLAMPAGIVVLYLLRRKYLPKQVPSTFLWRAAIRDHAANKPLQRLRKNLLLPVQFLAALLLALALMQPCLTGGEASRTVMIFDLSASMQTESDGRSRLEEAKNRAEEILGGLPPGEEITVLSASGEVRQVLSGSTDREDVRQAVRSLSCGREGADIGKAVSLAEAIRREETDRGTRIIVFSDNYMPENGVTAVNCGRGEENRGIYALTAEENSAYARICNDGGDCTLTVACEADGQVCDAKEIQIPAGETAGVIFTLPEGTVKAGVRIREADALEADNRAETAVKRSRTRTVALTGDNLFLESALQVRKDLRVVRTSAEAPAETEADLYVWGTAPLIFSRDPSRTAFSWSEEAKEASGALTAADSTVTEGLTLRNVTLRSSYTVSGGSPVLLAGDDVVAACTEDEFIFGFRLQDSNLPLKYDFPVLIQQILNRLLPEEVQETVETEAPVAREESDVRTVAPDAEGADGAAAGTRGQDLTGWMAGGFLVLLVIEFILSREIWVKPAGGKRKGAAA